MLVTFPASYVSVPVGAIESWRRAWSDVALPRAATATSARAGDPAPGSDLIATSRDAPLQAGSPRVVRRRFQPGVL